MESVEELKERARKSLGVAEHMLNQTYPVVNDPKLILAIAGDIYTALVSSMDAVLMNDKEEKSLLDSNFDSRLDAFKRLAPGRFTDEDISLVSGFHEIMLEHKASPVEFPRKDRFVICDENYRCETISIDDMKNYLFKARLFVEKSESIMENKEKS